jgi:AcrR family transcriptional regulator
MIHDAFIYSSDEEFAAVLVPFLRDAVVGGRPAIAIASDERVKLLEEGLGADAEGVSFFEASEWYGLPGAAVASWRAALYERHGSDAGLIHAIGEIPIGEELAGHERWARYESLLNDALAGAPAWVICSYDARDVPAAFIAEVRRSHPGVMTIAGREPSPEHFSAVELGGPLVPLGNAPVADDAPLVITTGTKLVAAIRRKLTWAALLAGLSRATIDDLALAVTQLATSSVDAGSRTTLHTGAAGAEWLCELASTGGSAHGAVFAKNSTPLVIGRLLCDRVEIGGGSDSSVVRFVFGPSKDPRQRILAAASALFSQSGFAATGVNAIITRAGVAKATFYSYFPSKDALVLEWLRSPEAQRFRDVWVEVEARTPEPADQLIDFFDVLGEWLADNAFRVWPRLATVAELDDTNLPARDELARMLMEPEEPFLRAATAAGLTDPEALAAQLNLLRIGAIAAAKAGKSRQPVEMARAAAVRLVAAARA